ncbi:DndE family protein [Flavobacterium sp. D11R37]|uniref:DndE family protein n=1 Tax=Flavobacterium coralii TaxID=2838017 RepID=UPI001CA66D4B|nr:DndE family protein [Flavobacterium coralii]MBY8961809.1 DndE family protein [Flavobacterium coralii]
MFTQIKTSKANKDIVTKLTRKLNLGTENIVARLAFSYSISQDRKLNLDDIQDSGGKEYSKSVLFGDYYDLYLGLLCVHYNIYKTDKDIVKYFKMHIDDGLTLLENEISLLNNLDGYDYLIDKISLKLTEI